MANDAAAPEALTPEFLASLRAGYEMDSADLARHNAVTNNKAALIYDAFWVWNWSLLLTSFVVASDGVVSVRPWS